MCGVISLDIKQNLGWGPSASARNGDNKSTMGSAVEAGRLLGGGVSGQERREGLAGQRLGREESRRVTGAWFGVKFSLSQQ